jgi:thiol-disulfide isomerase/thioredoxin
MTTRSRRTRGLPKRRAEAAATSNRMPILVIGGIVAVAIVAALGAVLLTTQAPDVAQPATTPVLVSGDTLPALTAGTADPAVGAPLPTLSGIGVDGQPLTIGPGDGPAVIVVLAHWCPHCQAELPRVVEWMEANEVPAGVTVLGLTTSIDPVRPNYPPSTWLEREGWSQPTLVDDASSSALQALGVGSFPAFVAIDGDGIVRQRLTGEIGGETFGQLLASVAE